MHSSYFMALAARGESLYSGWDHVSQRRPDDGARGHHQRLAGVPLAIATLALHLDDLELHTIRTLKEADPPAIARDHLL